MREYKKYRQTKFTYVLKDAGEHRIFHVHQHLFLLGDCLGLLALGWYSEEQSASFDYFRIYSDDIFARAM